MAQKNRNENESFYSSYGFNQYRYAPEENPQVQQGQYYDQQGNYYGQEQPYYDPQSQYYEPQVGWVRGEPLEDPKKKPRTILIAVAAFSAAMIAGVVIGLSARPRTGGYAISEPVEEIVVEHDNGGDFQTIPDYDGVYEITMNGETISLGDSVETISESFGIELDMPMDEMVEAGERSYTRDERAFFFLDARNVYDETTALGELPVDTLSMFLYDGRYSFNYMDGLTQESSPEDFIEVFGEDYHFYSYDTQDTYSWYTESGWVSAQFDDDALYYFSMHLDMY